MHTKFKLAFLGAASLGLLAPMQASAATYVVDALANSITDGTAFHTGLIFTSGGVLTVSSSTDDLWSAGSLPRYSDANGLVADRFATATDDSGQPVGTQIGANFGSVTIDGYSAPYGSLVGLIGGVYQTLGANYSGTAWNTGALDLFYWDGYSADNSGNIKFDIAGASINPNGGAVPEPTTWAMMLIGFGAVGFGLRRRKSAAQRFRYNIA